MSLEELLRNYSEEDIRKALAQVYKKPWYDNYVASFTQSEGTSIRRQVDAIWDRFQAMIDDKHFRRTAPDESENVECVRGLINPELCDRACGLVVGRVQSGKTRNYIGLALKAFSEGWNTVIILTSNNTSLARQTHVRLKKEFRERAEFHPRELYTFGNDASLLWNTEADWMPDRQYIGLAQKEDDHLARIIRWLDRIKGDPENDLGKMKLLIIDDESDSATPDSQAGSGIQLSETDLESLEEYWQNEIAVRWLKVLRAAVKAIESEREPAEIADEDLRVLVERLQDPDNAAVFTQLRSMLSAANKDGDCFKACCNAAGPYWRFLGFDREVEVRSDNGIVSRITVGSEISRVFNHKFNDKRSMDPSKPLFVAILRALFIVGIDRSKINRMICRIISRQVDQQFAYEFGKAGYIGYTATPAANLINETNEGNPLAADFAFSMEVPNKYFGYEKIFGDNEDSSEPNMNIVEIAGEDDVSIMRDINGFDGDGEFPLDDDLRSTNEGDVVPEWTGMKDALAWLFCAAAVRKLNWDALSDDRKRAEINERSTDGRWTTMLLNIDHRKSIHKELQKKLYGYLSRLSDLKFQEDFLARCERVWQRQTERFSAEDFRNSCGDYFEYAEDFNSLGYPDWVSVRATIKDEIFSRMNLAFKQPNGELDLGVVHVVNINSDVPGRNEPMAFNGPENMIRYASPNEVGDECHIWILCGGNTISRGLTLSGLTVSYFNRAKKSSAIDMLTQMGRWFGYRKGYELLPRVWMHPDFAPECKQMCHIEKKMHDAIRASFELGYSPKSYEHRLELLSYGRPLSGRDNAFSITSVGFSVLGDTFKTVPTDLPRRSRMCSLTGEFLGRIADRRDIVEGAHNYMPGLIRNVYYRNVSAVQVGEYLQDLKAAGVYGTESSGLQIDGLLREIGNNNYEWDVVVNNLRPEDGVPSGLAMAPLNTVYCATRREDKCVVGNGYITFGRMTNSDFRGNYSRIEERYLLAAECKLIKNRLRDPLCPIPPDQTLEAIKRHIAAVERGEEVLSSDLRRFFGTTRRTGDEFSRAVFGQPDLKRHRPILQLTLVRLTKTRTVQCEAGDAPFVVVSFIWPSHATDVYSGGMVRAGEIEIDDYSVINTIKRILDVDDYLHIDELKRRVACNLSIPEDDPVFAKSRFARIMAGGRGFGCLRNPGSGLRKGICYSTQWCGDADEVCGRIEEEVAGLFRQDYTDLDSFIGMLASSRKYMGLLQGRNLDNIEVRRKLWRNWLYERNIW